MELKNLEEMTSYLEEKFTSSEYKAVVAPHEEFGDSVKFAIAWVPLKPTGLLDQVGYMWCTPSGRTAAVPFKK